MYNILRKELSDLLGLFSAWYIHNTPLRAPLCSFQMQSLQANDCSLEGNERNVQDCYPYIILYRFWKKREQPTQFVSPEAVVVCFVTFQVNKKFRAKLVLSHVVLR